MVQVNYPHPQITHKFTIPSCSPSTELTYSHVALILVLLNTGSPSIPPRFHNIQEITSKHHALSKTRKQGRGRKLCPKHKPIPQLSLLTYPSNILFVPIHSPLDRLENFTGGPQYISLHFDHWDLLENVQNPICTTLSLTSNTNIFCTNTIFCCTKFDNFLLHKLGRFRNPPCHHPNLTKLDPTSPKSSMNHT